MKSLYVCSFIAFCLINTYLSGQSTNLVNNPGFEEYKECPQDYTPQDRSHKLIPGWSYPSIATPDYFNRCSPKMVGVPKNFAGESEPKSGNGYVGAILSGTDDGYREYVQGSLVKPLEANKKYCIYFSYKLASYSRFAVDQLSIYFSDIKIENEINVNLPFTPQITNKVGLFLDNIDDWEEMCTIYSAKGGEKFFVIGNFRSYDNTNYVVTDKTVRNEMNKAYAYYYFDDVVIRPLDNCTNCPCVQQDFVAQFIDTSFTGGYNALTGKIKRRINDGHIKVGMIGGTPPYRVEWSNGMTGEELRALPAGKYTYIAYDANNCQASGTIIFKEPEELVDDFEGGLESIEEGGSIVLENIFFEFNKTDLLPESFPELNKVADFVMNNNIQLIEISGHTDNVGTESYNQNLSEGRAQSVVNYLASKGIQGYRMKAVGYGELKPIETNRTDAGREQNRRVEFTLLKK